MKGNLAALTKSKEEELEEEDLVTIQLPRSKAKELLEILEKARKLIDGSWTTE
jgi:endonuclease III